MKKLFSSLKSKGKKLSAIFCAALMSMCMFVTSFAEETGSTGGSTINYSQIGEAFKTGVTDAETERDTEIDCSRSEALTDSASEICDSIATKADSTAISIHTPTRG